MCKAEQPTVEQDAKASATPSTKIPDYNERLGYGTDQGRWLMEQVNTKDGGDGAQQRRKAARAPQRVFHDVSLGPPEASSADSAKDDVKNGSLSTTTRRSQKQNALYAAIAFAALLLVYLLFFRSS